ncbi:hypothetical protein PQX77_017561 [Marasmius sp. AFHP31]|nr:hypothetical protein PQX77_017561 [Marasmius sp. AFHP31]
MASMFRRTITYDDKQVVTQMIANFRREIRNYEIEINKLKAAMVVLENKRSGTKKTMGQLQSLLSPIHRLPPEMLSRIFMFCSEKNQVRPDRMPPVSGLSVVCGRWREIVLSRPHLWASLSIPCWRWRRHQQPALNNNTEIFMARSRSFPLTIEIDFMEEDDDDELLPNLETFSALHVLVNHSARWVNLSLVGITPSMLRHPTFQEIRENLPHLQHLRITEGYSTRIATGQVLDIFAQCPLLRSIDLQPGVIANALVLPWGSIRRIAFSDALLRILPTLLNFLHQNPFDLELNMGDRTTRFDGQVVSMNTKSLSVTTFEQDHLARLFNSTTIPQLASLDIAGLFDKPQRCWERWSQSPIHNFLLRSACPITHLCLKWLPISSSQATNLFQLIPGLASLSIEEYPSERAKKGLNKNTFVTRNFLNRLSVDHGGASLFAFPPFILKLRDIALVINDPGLDEESLATAISSRWLPDAAYAESIGVNRLQSFAITVMGGTAPSGEAFSSLKFLRYVGVQLSLDRREKKRESPPSDSDSGKETEVDELASPPPSNKRPKLAFYLASKSQSSLNFSARKPRLLQGGPDVPKHGQKRRPVSEDEVLRMPRRSVKKPGSGRRSPALSSRTKDGVSGSPKRRPDHRRSDSSPRKKLEGEYYDLGCIEITSSEDERPRATNKNKSAKNPVEVIEITDNSDNDSELIQHSTSHKARDRSQTSLTMSSSREPSVTFVYERKRTGAGSSIIYTPSSSVDVVGTRPDDRGAGSNSPSPANAGSSESPFAGPSTRPILQTPKIFERSYE